MPCAGLALAAGVVCTSVAGAEDENNRVVLDAALQMRSAITGLPVLRGDRWQKMSPDEKLAFVSGVGT
jgi:hypothetical protein